MIGWALWRVDRITRKAGLDKEGNFSNIRLVRELIKVEAWGWALTRVRYIQSLSRLKIERLHLDVRLLDFLLKFYL